MYRPPNSGVSQKPDKCFSFQVNSAAKAMPEAAHLDFWCEIRSNHRWKSKLLPTHISITFTSRPGTHGRYICNDLNSNVYRKELTGVGLMTYCCGMPALCKLKKMPLYHLNSARMASTDIIYKEKGGYIYHLFLWLQITIIVANGYRSPFWVHA